VGCCYGLSMTRLRELPVTYALNEETAPVRGAVVRPSVLKWAVGVVAISAVTIWTGLGAAQAQNARVVHVSAKPASAAADSAGPESAPGTAAPVARSRLAGRYFVDFRSRTAASYGHAFIWYGRLNEHGRVGKVEVAGLHPATDSVVPYILGHIIPVPAETGKSYGDLDEQYLTASYRVYLNEADAKRVFAYIENKERHSVVWHAGLYNCTAFLADVAQYMGLRAPAGSTWMYPENMVNALRKINNGRTEVVLAPRAGGYD